MASNAPFSRELRALQQMDQGGRWELDGQPLELTNLDKVLFPGRGDEPPVTKRELIGYYTRIAPYLLPYLQDRPVNLQRFPNGVERPGFWQKQLVASAPAWLTRWHRAEAGDGDVEDYLIVDSVAALAWLGNQAAIELNPWTSTADDPRQPTWALIDLDPGTDTTFDEILELADLHRLALEQLGVAAAPKVTGRRGIQIWIPVGPGYTFDDTRAWVEGVSRAVGRLRPDLISWEWRTGKRGGRARLDYTQNAVNKTLVSAFSPRPAPGAPVSVPVNWEDLGRPGLRPDKWTIRTVLRRLSRSGDPLAPLIGLDQHLPGLPPSNRS